MPKTRVLLALMVFGGLLAGCGRTGKEVIDTPGAKVRYAPLRAKVRGLDPGDIGDTTSAQVASQCYECLYQYHYLKRPYEIIPCLAAGMPVLSGDGLTVTISLRRDIYFGDDPCFSGGKGRQLVAADFIYAWKRIANLKYRSKNWWVFDNKIVGLNEFRAYTAALKSAGEVDYSRDVAGLKAPDNFTLQLRLRKPWPQMRYLLAHLPTAPMAREAVEYYGDRIPTVMVGTGAFRLQSWKGSNTLILVRNARFRKEAYPAEGTKADRETGLLADAGKPLPLIDGIVYYVIEEDRPYWLSFMDGKIDSVGDRIPNDFYAQAISPGRALTPAMRARGMDLIVIDDPSTYWFGFNMDDPVVGKNLPLRRAMSVGFNREEFNAIINVGRAIPARGIFPPGFREYDPALKNPWGRFDPVRARELVKEAEKIAGGKITVTCSMQGTDTYYRQWGEYIKRSMAKIGVTVSLDFSDWPTFQDKVKTKSVQMFSLGWLADYPDASTFMEIFYGPNGAPGPNDFNYNSREFNELYRKTVDLPDTPQRLAQYRQLERIVCNDCPAIFSFHRVLYIPYYSYLKNYRFNAFVGEIVKYQDIDLGLRKKLIGR